MATPIYRRGLRLLLEADSLSGANGSPVATWADDSGYGRNLTATSNQPTIKTGAINGKKSVLFSGTNNPLANPDVFTIRCGFAVCKVDAFTNYNGIVSTLVNYPILIGGADNLHLWDNFFSYYEYRINDVIANPRTVNADGTENAMLMDAPLGEFAVIYFKFWTNLIIDGVQLGQDRDFNDRKLDGEIAFLALYDRDFCESEVRNQTRSLAYSYQIGLADVFPYQGMKSDAKQDQKIILSDEQQEPNVRIKRSKRTFFNLTFADRKQSEVRHSRAFWDEFYPSKRFIFRDYNFIPPVDTTCRFPVPSEFNLSNGTGSFEYNFNAVESVVPVEYQIPITAPVIPTEPPDIVSKTLLLNSAGVVLTNSAGVPITTN